MLFALEPEREYSSEELGRLLQDGLVVLPSGFALAVVDLCPV